MESALQYRKEAIRIRQLGREYSQPGMDRILERLSRAYEGLAARLDGKVRPEVLVVLFPR